MRQVDGHEISAKIEFEPSDLIEYGDVSHQTRGGGGPAAQPDGAVYNS